ncbi:hypothetical protein O3M35_007850 [Rhynocoris fuscipes]|uniref:Uncharacterized protein n=1 Tax=Rhynocoris fuscipes TaxID=488301 RepID=A0AAW1DC83_9HEMI
MVAVLMNHVVLDNLLEKYYHQLKIIVILFQQNMHFDLLWKSFMKLDLLIL